MKKILGLIICLLLFNSGQAQTSKVLIFKVEGLSCWSCANTATSILEGIEGVDSASVNFDTKEGIAYTDGSISEQAIKDAIKKKNFEALFADEVLITPLTSEELEKLDIVTVKGGEKINFTDYLTKGKIIVFDFYADWCGPCRVFSPKLEHLVYNNPNVALRKVDIIKWESDVAKQLTKKYKMPALPFTLVFNDEGELLGIVEGNNVEKVEELIKVKK
jgi:thiol-disulfide isomerase/thioredoxin